jgi:hypothetical protein
MPIGDKLTTDGRYIKHPAYGSDYWVDGASVDAGEAHLVHSNLSTLSECNRREVAHLVGPGGIVGYDTTKSENPYVSLVGQLVDAFPPTDPADPNIDYLRIAWLVDGLGDCVCMGPLCATPVTLVLDPAGYVPRKVRVLAECSKGNGSGGTIGSLYFVAALTLGPTPPSVQPPLTHVVSSTYTTAGAITLDIDLELDGPIRSVREMFSRADASTGETTTRLLDLYVWLGWYSTNTGTGAGRDAVYTIDCMETV